MIFLGTHMIDDPGVKLLKKHTYFKEIMSYVDIYEVRDVLARPNKKYYAVTEAGKVYTISYRYISKMKRNGGTLHKAKKTTPNG